jgi:hypothetical protein
MRPWVSALADCCLMSFAVYSEEETKPSVEARPSKEPPPVETVSGRTNASVEILLAIRGEVPEDGTTPRELTMFLF